MKLKIYDCASGIKDGDMGILWIGEVPVAYSVDWMVNGKRYCEVFGYN